MKTIEEYIELSKNMENVSDGGSDCFLFADDNVVLVKYSCDNRYGIAREKEEEVAKAINMKNEEGVNTPKHLSIYRTKDEKNNYCYVLEQAAKGISYSKYADCKFGDVKKNIECMKKAANIPKRHIEKAIKDVSSLFNMGLELKSKNFFYDEDFGFSIIDFLKPDGTCCDYDNPEEVMILFRNICVMISNFYVSKYDHATDDEIDEFYYYKGIVIDNILDSFDKVLPDFSRYRRLICRNLDSTLYSHMKKDGYLNEDLMMNEEEMEEFDNSIENLIKECLSDLFNGNYTYDEFMINIIRLKLDALGLTKSWKFNPKSDYDFSKEDYGYESDFEDNFKDEIYKYFKGKIKEMAEISENMYIQSAYNEIMDEEERKKKMSNTDDISSLIGGKW